MESCTTISGNKCRDSPEVICGKVHHEEVWKDVFRDECGDIPHKLSEEDILVVCKDVLKEECSNVPRTEYENITVEDHSQEFETCRWETEDLWNNVMDMEAALGMGLD